MPVLRFSLLLIMTLAVFATAGCAQTPDREAMAREELANRRISVDLAGLKQSTSRPNLDGAYLFEDVGYFSRISDSDFKEALKHAAATRNYGLYVMLQRHGKDVRYPPGELLESLDLAARSGSSGMAALLIRHGAQPGDSTLFHAAYSDSYRLAELLAAQEVDFTTKRNSEALRMAARLGNLSTLKAFMDSGKAPEELINRAIIFGALTEQFEVVRYLVEHGVDVDHEDSDGCTALHYLAQDGTVEMIRYLVERGAAVNKTCRGKETPLKWAHYGDNSEVIEFLAGAGGVLK